MKLIARILVGALALLLVARIVPGIEVAGIYIAIITALILGIMNVLVKPILIILTLPITIVTLGLFMFVINASIFWFVSTFIDGFSVSGFLPALLGSVLVSILSAIGNKLIE